MQDVPSTARRFEYIQLNKRIFNIMYDYYYSLKHEKHLKRCRDFRDLLFPFTETTIHGIPYTEMISEGETPVTEHFGDLIKVYTGDMEGIEIKK